jgi:hypothetical protein
VLHVNYSVPTNKGPPEGKTTEVIAVIRGKPKDGYRCHRSNKHRKQKLERVLLDSGTDSNFVFVSKDKPIMLPVSKRLVPQLWNTSNRIFQTKGKTRLELNFFEYSDSKRYYSDPDVFEYNYLILGTKAMKELVNNTPVDEQIGCWSVVKKRYKRVEYVAVK